MVGGVNLTDQVNSSVAALRTTLNGITDATSAEAAVRVRHLAETVPISDLGGIVVRALDLIDTLCWESLERGDVVAFANQSRIGAELLDFGECSCLLADG